MLYIFRSLSSFAFLTHTVIQNDLVTRDQADAMTFSCSSHKQGVAENSNGEMVEIDTVVMSTRERTMERAIRASQIGLDSQICAVSLAVHSCMLCSR